VKIPLLPISWVALVGLPLAPALAGDVFNWRNGGNGLYPEAKPATDWTAAASLKWETPLPERSNGCPILVGGKLLFTAEPATLICADAATGKILWEKANEYADLAAAPGQAKDPAAEAEAKANEEKAAPLERELYRSERRLKREPDNKELQSQIDDLKKQLAALKPAEGGNKGGGDKMPPTNNTNGYSSYTPVSDGKHVWACFGNGVVVCYDMAGTRIWGKRAENPDHDWGGACSPTLVDGKLIVRFKDYLALDPATGKELWRTPSGGVTFNCPANFELDGRHYLYTSRGELFRASDGKKLPSQDFANTRKSWAFFNTPSVIGKRIFGAHGSEGDQGDAYAMEIPATAALLEKDGLKKVWQVEVNKNRYYSSPLVHDGIVYILTREYQMQALDAATGKQLYSEKVKGFTGTAYPSLTLAGGLIFVGAEDGNAAFVKPGGKYEEVSRFKMDDFRSTPIFDGELTYLRTQEKLRAIRHN
jgi:outer membrane protein assembly factor BamB